MSQASRLQQSNGNRVNQIDPAAPSFVHLHTHSEYSLLDGTMRIKEMVARAKEMGHTHLALTDHGTMHGAIEFYSTCKALGITPIIGCEIYHSGLEATADLKDLLGEQSSLPFHLVVLAQDTQGYKTLLKLVSSGFVADKAPDIPLVSDTVIDQHNQKTVALSGCLRGEFGFLVAALHKIQGKPECLDLESQEENSRRIIEVLREHVSRMHQRFGPENYYIELIDNKLPQQRELLPHLVQVARYFQLPLVATADAHYLDSDSFNIHSLAVAIKNSLTMSDIRNRMRNTTFHLTNDLEMASLFESWPDALANTLEIAKKCSDLTIEMGTYYLPKIDLGTSENPTQALDRIAREGLEDRFKVLDKLYGPSFDDEKKKEYWERLDYELKVIIQMGFPDYFLIVQDFINWAKSQGIPVGPGRGSGAGSLVAYALRITDLDPIPYTLIFERFLNPERVSMPDFDVDFCQWRREEVINYCIRKYGATQVAQITTFGKMQAKGAVKSVGRALNLGYSRVDQFTKLFPPDLGITLKEALAAEPRLTEEMEKDEALKECTDSALRLEGLASHTSVHAAGIVISDGPMTDYVPIYTTDGKSYITQYEMKPTEKVGLVKFDFLGLKTLTVIDKAVQLVHGRHDPDFDIGNISLDDQQVYNMISAGHTCGVFQCESAGMTQLIMKLKPSTFEDVIALVALFRPGPLGSGMVDDFVERKHGRQAITYPHPLLEPILKDTYGMILYQEQVQKIAAVLAKYSLGEADLLRRAMGKKIPEEMAKQKDRFVSGSVENEIDQTLAEEIFELMAEFAKYGFNKSHSAAYGLVSYQTAFLKTHFPEEFLAASMTCDMDNTDKIVRYVEDCRRLKIEVRNPTVNQSDLEFSVPANKVVDFALSAIKGVGEGAVKPLLEERAKNGPFSGLTDMATRVNLGKVGKKTLQLLSQSGALDDMGLSRSYMFKTLPDIVTYSVELHEAKQTGQRSIFDLGGDESEIEAKIDENHPWDRKANQLSSGRRPWGLSDILEEKKTLGIFLTAHPLELFPVDRRCFGQAALRKLLQVSPAQTKLEESRGRRKKNKVTVLCFFAGAQLKRTKKGTLMAYVRLEEPNFSTEAMMFEQALKERDLPATDTAVIAVGAVDSFGDGPPRLTLDRLIPLEQVRHERVEKITFHIKSKPLVGTELEAVQNLRELMEPYRGGQTKVAFKMHHKGFVVHVNTDSDFSLDLTDHLLSGFDSLPFDGFSYDYRLGKSEPNSDS